ncbi:methionyl-tRNA synthetase, partial [Tulasnella sp. 403]
VSKETGSKVEWMEEENYKFRLSAFREPLIEWLDENPRAIIPESRYKEVYNSLAEHHFVDGKKVYLNPLEDLSVSRPRSRLSWGIPVPNDPEHTIYVWIDALTNYLTVIGYPWTSSPGSTALKDAWPADVQVIGKDIVRFHAIYWPAMLIALGLSPPRTLLAHAHWTIDRQKMSKSRGNVADPFDAMRKFGVDPIRYYLIRNGGIAIDADWSEDQIVKHYKRDLAGVLGNLVNRISSVKLLEKLPEAYEYRRNGDEIAVRGFATLLRNEQNATVHDLLWGRADTHPGALRGYQDKMDDFELARAVEVALELVLEANRFFTHMEPWATTDVKKILMTHLYVTQTLHVAGVLLQPVMPNKSRQLLDRLGVAEDQRTWSYLQKHFGNRHDEAGEGWVRVSCRPAPTSGQLFPKLES